MTIQPKQKPSPVALHDGTSARAAKAAIDAVRIERPDEFRRVFLNEHGNSIEAWDKQDGNVKTLVDIGLLEQLPDGKWRCPFLLTTWEDHYYLSDWPGGEQDFDEFEVFCPHVETRFFSNLCQARPGDYVLDLGTGSGILLIEAARRGARGLGIDISLRALDFARANAQLNGLADRVRFDRGDITDPAQYQSWGSPNLVICNPPFEPVPDDLGFPRRPLHSAAGPTGDGPTRAILAALRSWSHRPDLFQFVLFSLGSAPEAENEPDHIFLTEPLRRAAGDLGCMLELRELLRPLKIDDYLVLNFRRGTNDAEAWRKRMSSAGLGTLHLLFANLYACPGSSRGGVPTTRWTRHRNTFPEDVCFVWPLGVTSRSRGSDGAAEGDFIREHLNSLIVAKEKSMEGQTIDLRLDDVRIQSYLRDIISDGTLYGRLRPLVILDIPKPAAGDNGSEVGLLTIAGDDVVRFEKCDDRKLEETLGTIVSGRVFTMSADVRVPDATSPDFIRTCIDSMDVSKLASLRHWSGSTFQRFVVISSAFQPLTPLQQLFFAHFLSELAAAAIRERARTKEVLADASFMLGHDLKNRLGTLPMQALIDSLWAGDTAGARSQALRLDREVDSLYCIGSLFSVLAKSTEGCLPLEWLAPKFRSGWPRSFSQSDLRELGAAFGQLAAEAILAVDRDNELAITMIDADGPHVIRAEHRNPISRFSPFNAEAEQEIPAAAFLAGLAELCRNAARAVLNPSKREFFMRAHGGLKIEYEVSTDSASRSVTVTVWNPFVGKLQKVTSLDRIQNVYREFGDAIRLEAPVIVDANPHRPGPGQYAMSSCTFYPARLNFRRKTAHEG
ncbi:methyltransferase domain-containing protein [Paludibaculum fermentans]|uniref:Methyltransferase domain-containing protein n=1 Tax=Paludibaculum fermentans TaxID=1473598 RepID=A0A7S7NQX8_PALFE|nr:methyltransferase domain-containing protein [Paludibaculum fermentans]QOY88172.1 methyltransferase domain-containing protein [Paludibaculum fermentans]